MSNSNSLFTNIFWTDEAGTINNTLLGAVSTGCAGGCSSGNIPSSQALYLKSGASIVYSVAAEPGHYTYNVHFRVEQM